VTTPDLIEEEVSGMSAEQSTAARSPSPPVPDSAARSSSTSTAKPTSLHYNFSGVTNIYAAT